MKNITTSQPLSVSKLPNGMKHDKKLLLSVFEIQNPSHNRACNDHAINTIIGLAPKGCTVVRKQGNLLIRKGPIEGGPMPFFLSHMDQVHDYVPFMKVHMSGVLLHATDGNGERCGVGGDDKCGIYMALLMLHHLERCTAVFVRDEEVGCEGSGTVPLTWFDQAAFVIQADRNNHSMDIIRDTNSMECASDAFMDALLKLPIVRAAGHTENTGSITDIGELAQRGLRVSMVNISSGYHHPHTSREVVMLDELGIACQLAFEAATTLGDRKWDHIPSSTYVGRYTHGSTYGGHGASYYDGSEVRGSRKGAWGWDEEDLLTEEEALQLEAELASEMASKEEAISRLTNEFGYDREFDGLDSVDYDTLWDLVAGCEAEMSSDLEDLGR